VVSILNGFPWNLAENSLFGVSYTVLFYLFICLLQSEIGHSQNWNNTAINTAHEYWSTLSTRFGLTSVSQLGKMVYLALYRIQIRQIRLKLCLKFGNPVKNLRCSTAITRQKKQIWLEMYTFLSKNIAEVPNSLWKAVRRCRFFDSGTVVWVARNIFIQWTQPRDKHCASFCLLQDIVQIM